MNGPETRLARLVGAGAFPRLFGLMLLAIGHAAGVTGLDAQQTWTLEFTDNGTGPTFLAESQPVTVQDVMGSTLASTDSFRLQTHFTDARLAGCESTRPDLPDAVIVPTEVTDRVGSLSLAVFEDGQVNYSFRTTDDGAEYAITMNANNPDAVEVVRAVSGELLLLATGAPLSVTRNKTEMFSCTGAADFSIKLAP